MVPTPKPFQNYSQRAYFKGAQSTGNFISPVHFFRIKVTLLSMFPINIPELRGGSKEVVIILKYLIHVVSSQIYF